MEILPVLDPAVLQEKANEHAMKGAIETFKDFYSGYNSPYRKAIEEDLKKKEIGIHIQLPDIIAIINESLSAEVDKIANQAIAKSFIPLLQKFLTRIEGDILFSDIMKHFVECIDDNELYSDDYSCRVDKDDRYGWLNVKMSAGSKDYEFTLHENHDSKKTGDLKHSLLGLPYSFKSGSTSRTMKLEVEQAKLELPFTSNILQDDFMSYLARIVICQPKITMDQDYFTEDMFPDRCHC